MSTQERQRELGLALRAVSIEQDRAERYRQRQRQARSGRARVANGTRPLQFDESGFPIAQRNSTFIRRVARLLNPL